MSIIALDFETSGSYAGCACALGMVKIEDLQITETFYSLIRPLSRRIHYTHVHGLTWKDLKDAPSFRELWPDIWQFMKGADYFMAHNASFDRSVMAGCCIAFSQDVPAQQFLCTLKGSRRALKLPSRSLDSVCAYFNIELDHHHAGSDARGCAEIYINLRKIGLTDEDMLLAPAKKKRVSTNPE